MIPVRIKNLMTKNELLNLMYSALKKVYLSHLRNTKCARLRRHGLEIVRKVDRILSATHARYFGDYGTMLGVVRDKQFIRYDDDVDYSIIEGTLSPRILLDLFNGKDGFEFSHAFEFREKIAQVTFLYKKIEVDFFYIYEDGKIGIAPLFLPTIECPYHSIGNSWDAVYLERPAIQEIKPYDFMGVNIMIPGNYDDILTNCYGDWRIPVKKWSHTGKTGQKERIKCADKAIIVGIDRVYELCN